jgi:antirestriction protein ArdC
MRNRLTKGEKPMKQDVYQKVTDKIIADLEKGELTWLKPWSAGNMDGGSSNRCAITACPTTESTC